MMERFVEKRNTENEIEIIDREGFVNLTSGYQVVQMLNNLDNCVFELKKENKILTELLRKTKEEMINE